MGFVTKKENFFVKAEPKISSYWRNPTEAEIHDHCKSVAAQIDRHVDGVYSAEVVFETNKYCEHCGSEWTEESPTYNGGCCNKDEENSPEPEAA